MRAKYLGIEPRGHGVTGYRFLVDDEAALKWVSDLRVEDPRVDFSENKDTYVREGAVKHLTVHAGGRYVLIRLEDQEMIVPERTVTWKLPTKGVEE